MSALRLLDDEPDEGAQFETDERREVVWVVPRTPPPMRLLGAPEADPETVARWWPDPEPGQPYLRIRHGIAADTLTAWTDHTADLTRWAESLPGGRIEVWGVAEPFGRLTPAEGAALASGAPLARRESLLGVVDHGAVHLSRVVLPDKVEVSVLGVKVTATREGDRLVLTGRESMRALMAAVESLERLAETSPKAAAALARVRSGVSHA